MLNMKGTLTTDTWEAMMPSEDPILQSNNLSHAWGKLLLRALGSTGGSCGPLVVSITGLEGELPAEDDAIRARLDDLLRARNRFPCSVSSMIVFPYREWVRRGRPECNEFRQWCIEKFVPRLKACNRQNSKGLYFERMMDFKGAASDDGPGIDQLQHIIDWWNGRMAAGRPRPPHSRMQVVCFDPCRDHNHECRPWFPCLQQVSFIYEGKDKLIVCGYYPTQHIFDRAYGNFMGLCRLGAFMAQQLDLRLSEMTCFIGRASLGSINKTDIGSLANDLRKLIDA